LAFGGGKTTFVRFHLAPVCILPPSPTEQLKTKRLSSVLLN
jgi:hypothetical protein